MRETKSYAIFTTESGEQQDVEQTPAGIINPDTTNRLVLFKRKQIAPERRMGKALMRQYGVFPYAICLKDGEVKEVVYGSDNIEDAKTRFGDKNVHHYNRRIVYSLPRLPYLWLRGHRRRRIAKITSHDRLLFHSATL
jgi:hypothetical protein